MGAGDDYLRLSDRELFDQCRFERFRASGPGGQHRNKTDSGVRLTHQPTGIAAEATERRSQQSESGGGAEPPASGDCGGAAAGGRSGGVSAAAAVAADFAAVGGRGGEPARTDRAASRRFLAGGAGAAGLAGCGRGFVGGGGVACRLFDQSAGQAGDQRPPTAPRRQRHSGAARIEPAARAALGIRSVGRVGDDVEFDFDAHLGVDERGDLDDGGAGRS